MALICISTAISSFAQKSSSDEPFTQEKPVWKCLFLLYPHADVNCAGSGSFTNNVPYVISKAHCDSLIKKAEGFKWYVEESTHHRVEVQFDTIISGTPIERMQSTGYGDACVVVPDYDKTRLGYSTNYDVVFVIANHRNGTWGGLAWGRDGSNGPLRITLIDYLGDTNGWSAFGHEFTHSYMQVQGAAKHVNPSYLWADSYGSFGYNDANQAGSPWYKIHPFVAFYHDIMEGTLTNYNSTTLNIDGRTFYPGQKYLGTHPSAWRFTAKKTYPQWSLKNSFIKYEYEDCSGRVLMTDQDIPMTENLDFKTDRDANGIIKVIGIGDYTDTIYVTATSNPQKYALKWETYGGTAIADDSVYCNTTLTEPAKPSKTDHVFDGWFKEPTCRTEWVFWKDKTTESDLTLYAKWVRKSGGTYINVGEASPPASGTGWTYSNGVFTVQNGANVTVAGTASSRYILVEENATATITLAGVDINNFLMTGSYYPAIDVTNANVTILLYGKNSLRGAKGHAGIEQRLTGTLTIDRSAEDDGVLYATGGQYAAGIGGQGHTILDNSCGSIVINGGVIYATCTANLSGSGIGGGRRSKTGNITVNGGIIAALGAKPGGSGIGKGQNGTLDFININGGTVYAQAYDAEAISNGTASNMNIGPGAVVFMTSESLPYQGTKDAAALVREELATADGFLAVAADAVSMKVKSAMTISGNMTLGVPPGGIVTVADGVGLTNNGTILAYRINGVVNPANFAYGDIENWDLTAIETPLAGDSHITVYAAGNGRIHINADEQIKSVVITDIGGRTVFRSNALTGVAADISTGILTQGVYIVSVETGKDKLTKKIIL